jgi:hypothetical protein
MGIDTEKYIKKPLIVDAVRVTPKNFNEIVEWCQGEVMSDDVTADSTVVNQYIKIRVHNPKNPRQTKAFVGDWVLYTERGYKIYTNKAFRASFGPVTEQEDATVVAEDPTTDIPAGAPVVDPVVNEQDDESVVRSEEAIRADAEEVATPVPAAPTPVATPAEAEESRLQTETGPDAKIKHEPQDRIHTDRRVISRDEASRMTPHELQAQLRSGEAVLEQDVA